MKYIDEIICALILCAGFALILHVSMTSVNYVDGIEGYLLEVVK